MLVIGCCFVGFGGGGLMYLVLLLMVLGVNVGDSGIVIGFLFIVFVVWIIIEDVWNILDFCG